MNLVDTIKDLQRELGLIPDGKAGPVTIGAALAEIRANRMEFDEEKVAPARLATGKSFDPRTEAALLTLDPKAVPAFRQFLCLAKATAASLGCDYLMIGGNRTWDEQDALFAIGRNGDKRARVTKAKGGQSNHNFGIAGDFGVFQGKLYLDESKPELAAKVHRACSMQAEACGLEWGGSWKSMTDMPHYEVSTGLTMMAKRNLYQTKGSVL